MANKQEIINILEKNFSFIDSNGKRETVISTFLHPNIPQKKLSNAQVTHELTESEEILWMVDHTFFGSAKESTLITNLGISMVFSQKEGPHKVNWDSIESVEYKDDNFYFYANADKSKHIIWYAPTVFATTLTGKALNGKKGSSKDFFDFFAEVITQIGSMFCNTELELYQNLLVQSTKHNHAVFLSLCDKYLATYGDYAFYSNDIRFLRAEHYYQVGLYDRASSDTNTLFSILTDTEDFTQTVNLFELSGRINWKKNNLYEALREFQYARDEVKSYDEKTRLSKIYEEIYQDFRGNFMNLNYDKRKLLLVSDTVTDLSKESFTVVRKSNLPPIQFPVGHPSENELYIGHPYKADIYIPLGSYEGDLFRDREEEFCLLLQCLGATELTTTKRKVRSSDEFNETKSNVTGKGNIKVHKAQIHNTTNTDQNTEQSMEANVSKTQKFSPTKKPYLPEGLIWYKNEPSWQRLYQQRMNGSIIEYHEQLSSAQKKILSNNEFRKIEAEYSNLLVSAEVAVTQEIQHKFKQEEFAESTISVVFAPLGDLTEEIQFSSDGVANSERDTQSFSANEQDYIEMYKDAYEDFVISPDERRMLERRRQRSGLSEEAAAILEERINWKNNFTDQEIEYMEEAKFCFENDDTITPDERRLLDRVKVKFNLTDHRVAELEEFVLSN